MQKNIVWKHLQAFVENTRLAAGRHFASKCHALVISRDQEAKIVDTLTLGKRDEWHFFVFVFFGSSDLGKQY